jgi:hypothetical protein
MNSPELQAIISEVVKKRDPLDESNFDVPSYINKLFPTGGNFPRVFYSKLHRKVTF